MLLCLPVCFSELCSKCYCLNALLWISSSSEALPHSAGVNQDGELWVGELSASCSASSFQHSAARGKKKVLFMKEVILGARFPARDRLTASPCRNWVCLVPYPKFLVYNMTSTCHKLCICQCDQSFVLVHSVFWGLGFVEKLHRIQSLQKATRYTVTRVISGSAPRS